MYFVSQLDYHLSQSCCCIVFDSVISPDVKRKRFSFCVYLVVCISKFDTYKKWIVAKEKQSARERNKLTRFKMMFHGKKAPEYVYKTIDEIQEKTPPVSILRRSRIMMLKYNSKKCR